MRLKWRNAWHGALIYAGGDSVASALTGDFQAARALGMLLVGGGWYAIEIPAYFRWLDGHINGSSPLAALRRALWAQAFFNPIWIARHLALIRVFSGRVSEIDAGLFVLGWQSFLHALPVALSANFLIQNVLPLPWRFCASALFSSSMAVYYALSEVWFG